MKFCIITVIVLLECQALILRCDDPIGAFEEFKKTHNKFYSTTEEENIRFKIFKDNLNKVVEHNRRYDAGEVKYTIGINQFSDLTFEEFSNIYLHKIDLPEINEKDLHVSSGPVKDAVDWRKENAVTEVENQKGCGSCWSFSATGALEGQLAIKNKELIPLSKQNLMDCSGGYGNEDCEGGWPHRAFEYVLDHGITTEKNYPYTATKNNCTYNELESVMSISGLKMIKAGNESDLQSAVSQIGPISVSFQLENSLINYKGGIYHVSCNGNAHHAVLVVGYGTENDEDYWIVKNSWGDKWGEKGYIRVRRNQNIGCIANYGAYPLM